MLVKRLILLVVLLCCIGGCGKQPAPTDLDTTPGDEGQGVEGAEYPPKDDS